MNCQSVRAQLVGQWEELQDGFPDHGVRQHLDACVDCRQLAAQYSQSHRWLEDLPQVEPAENFEWRLRLRLNQIDKEGVDAMREPSMIAENGRRSVSTPFIGSAVAAAAVVLVVGIAALRPSGTGLSGGESTPTTLVQEAPATPETRAQAPADVRLRLVGDDRPGLPNLAPTRPSYLKVVPVKSGAPLGPDTQTPPAPSILGEDILRLPTPLPR